MVELTGLEPVTYTLRTYRSSQTELQPHSKLNQISIFWPNLSECSEKCSKCRLQTPTFMP